MEYTNHPSLNVWVPLLNNLLMAPSSVKCTETLASSSAILEAKTALCKDFEPLVVTLETKLDHYFNEQNGKLIKVSFFYLTSAIIFLKGKTRTGKRFEKRPRFFYLSKLNRPVDCPLLFFTTASHVTCVLANIFSELQGGNKHYGLTHLNDFGDKLLVFV